MDFRLTDEQVSLQDAIRTFCAANYSFDRVATLDASRSGLPSGRQSDHLAGQNNGLRLDDWQRLTELDVFGVATPSERGGLGLGVVESAVVFEVLGSHLVPGPLVWSALAMQYVPELASGHAVVGGVDIGVDAGKAVLVEHGLDLTGLVALHDDGVDFVDLRVDGTSATVPFEAVTPTDPLTPVALAVELPAGQRVADARAASAMRITGAVLSSALLVGLADRSVQAAVAYTRERHQFGRPVGAFQAVQHLIADMYVRASLARGATYGAAAIVDDLGAGDPATAASNAKLLAADAAIRNARSCIQVHGGMGFTWEMIPHYLLKRAWVLEQSFGTRAQHAETVATALEREVA